MKELDHPTFVELIDQVYDEIIIWDNNYTMIYANKATYRHYGLSPEELIGKTLPEMTVQEKYWAPTSIPYIYQTKKAVIQKQKTLLGIDIVTISVPILDENNNVKYVLQSVRDSDENLYRKLAPITAPNAPNASDLDNYIIYKSEKMKQVMEFARKIAPVKVPCMILGETGTGKSLLAKYIHDISGKKDKPFISINMASLSPSIIESEIFGYKKGAFTGANREGKKGLFELANGGTLFLDEIGEIPYDLQSKFLHVIQEEEFIPIGGMESVKLDVRIICATNCDLMKMVEAGRFREDLYHRLNVFEITIPPLRQRVDDLALLIAHFLNVFNKKYSKNSVFSKKALDVLMRYPWRGNVRELSNVVERSVLTAEGDMIETADLPGTFFKIDNVKRARSGPYAEMGLEEALESLEREMILQAYKDHKSTRKVAKALSISQSKASRLINKYVEPQDRAD